MSAASFFYMEKFTKLRKFQTKDQFIKSMELHFYHNKHNFTKSDIRVFNCIKYYLGLQNGVCWLSKNTIAEKVGVSIATVKRAISKIVKLGIIERKEVMREKSGGNGANIYVALPHNDPPEKNHRKNKEKPCDSKDEPKKSKNEYYIPSTITNNIINKNVKITWVKYVPKMINKLFVGIFQHELKDLWFKIMKAFKDAKSKISREQKHVIGMKVMKSLVRCLKKGQAQSLDEKRAFVYVAAKNQIESFDDYNNKPVRVEKLPDWFESRKEVSPSSYEDAEDKKQFEELKKLFE